MQTQYHCMTLLLYLKCPTRKGMKRSKLVEDLILKWCYLWCKKRSYKIMQGPLSEDFIKIPTGSSHQDLRTREDFTRISTRSSHKDLCEIMQGPLLKDFSRIFRRASHKDLYKVMQRPLRGFHQDLDKIFSEGPGQDHARTS